MNECIELNLAYQEAYRTTRQEMIDSGAKQAFNFSEVQIFGNMNLFTQRLEYLTRVLQTLGQYATLREFVLEGRIAWARCLYQRLEAPMNALGKRATKILLTEEGQELIALYNDTVGNLVGYEITVYQTWSKMLLKKMSSMGSSVIIFCNEPPPFGRPYVNMDPEVIGLLREIECLDKLQCPIPKIAEEFWLKSASLKDNFEQLKLMCNEYVRITKLVPSNLTMLVAPTVQLINTALQPGITLHNWTSVSLKPYTEVSANYSQLITC
ncbi:hypothetical protein AHF37_10045 [Paragonimus kellicotti]|nr:hypothetical protein AHF37_10045 [Paragonimus kellicotti]